MKRWLEKKKKIMENSNKKDEVYVLGMMLSLEVNFIGKLVHCEPNYLVLKDSCIVGIRGISPIEKESLESAESEEEVFDIVSNMVIEPLGECNDNFVVSGDFYMITISKENYHKTLGAEWTLPKELS